MYCKKIIHLQTVMLSSNSVFIDCPLNNSLIIKSTLKSGTILYNVQLQMKCSKPIYESFSLKLI